MGRCNQIGAIQKNLLPASSSTWRKNVSERRKVIRMRCYRFQSHQNALLQIARGKVNTSPRVGISVLGIRFFSGLIFFDERRRFSI